MEGGAGKGGGGVEGFVDMTPVLRDLRGRIEEARRKVGEEHLKQRQ